MKTFTMLIATLLIGGCASTQTNDLPRAQNVDLKRFMGDWYVIANIPTFIEKNAHNAVENYSMNNDGTIATTFSFNKKSFDGERIFYYPKGYVNPEDNSLWGMQFIWPFKAEYVIAYLSPDYQHTIIARSDRDYLWIMARTPLLSSETYNYLINLSLQMGYDKKLIQKIPQQWRQSEAANEFNQSLQINSRNRIK